MGVETRKGWAPQRVSERVCRTGDGLDGVRPSRGGRSHVNDSEVSGFGDQMDPITSSLTTMENLGGGADSGVGRVLDKQQQGACSPDELQGHCSALALE